MNCFVASLATLALDGDVVKLISIVEEFMDVFLEELSGLSPSKKIEFAIKLVLNTKPISITYY